MTELKKEGVLFKSTPDALIGAVLNERYEVLELVGSGAMGSLYRGRHRVLDRPVAIKFLHAHLAKDDVHMERFCREAKLAASLSHPNVVHVYDVGNAEDGSPYLVMDFLDGKSLATMLREMGAFPIKRALPLMSQIAQGLAYAHSKGLLHRDLKLSNIMLVNDSGYETAKIIDFGIAKLMTEDEANQLTQTGEVFGSPLYMSPEQCQGHKLDERSDIYSAGCVMYEMLTGTTPFKGDNIVATVYKQMKEDPAPFSVVAPDSAIPPVLEQIVFKALQKDPSKRFQNANELNDAIGRVKESLPTPAQPEIAEPEHVRPTMVPSEQVAQKSGSSFAMIVAVTLLLGAGVVAFILTQKPAPLQTPAGQNPNEVYNGDDAGPFIWHNAAAAGQPVDVLMCYTHQTSNQPRSKDINYEFLGDAKVHVTNKHKDVILVLGGFAPIKWTVQADPGVNIKKVILSGYQQQQVAGLSPSVPVVESSDNLPPDRRDRTDNAFTPFGASMPSFSSSEDPTANSYFQPIREIVKKQADGNDITTLVEYGQTHQFDI